VAVNLLLILGWQGGRIQRTNNIVAGIGKIHWLWYKMSFGVTHFSIGLKFLWDYRK
jgi:hypothetical protein